MLFAQRERVYIGSPDAIAQFEKGLRTLYDTKVAELSAPHERLRWAEEPCDKPDVSGLRVHFEESLEGEILKILNAIP